MTVYIACTLGAVSVGALAFYYSARRGILEHFTTQEVITLGLFICLLFVAVLPWKVGLRSVPFIHSFVYTVPYTCMLITGIVLVGKPGTASILVIGGGLFRQLLFGGINPISWPQFLCCAFVMEVFFAFLRNYARTPVTACGGVVLRGLVSYLYIYLVQAPFLWHRFYAPWYVILQTAQGIVWSAVGGYLGWRLGRVVERAFKHSAV